MKIIGFLLGIVAIVLGVSWAAVHHAPKLFETAVCVGSSQLNGLVASCDAPVSWGLVVIAGCTALLGYLIWKD